MDYCFGLVLLFLLVFLLVVDFFVLHSALDNVPCFPSRSGGSSSAAQRVGDVGMPCVEGMKMIN